MSIESINTNGKYEQLSDNEAETDVEVDRILERLSELGAAAASASALQSDERYFRVLLPVAD